MSDDNKKSWRGLIGKLKQSTILSNPVKHIPLDSSFIRKIRDAIYPGYLNPALSKISNPYKYAKTRLNDLWSPDINTDATLDDNPLSKLTTLRGAMAAYWTGEQLKESLKPTLGIVGLVTFSSVVTMQMLEAYASTLSTLFNDGDFIKEAAKFGAYGVANVVSYKQMEKLENKLERGMAFYLRDQFRKVLEKEPEILPYLKEKYDNLSEEGQSQESPHHAISRAPEELSRNLVRMGLSGYASVSTSLAMIYGLAQKSAEVPILGEHGTLVLATAIVGSYSAFTYMKGAKLGKEVEIALEVKQKAEANLTEDIVVSFDKNSMQGNNIQHFLNKFSNHNQKVFDDSANHDKAEQAYQHFMQVTGLAGFFVSPLPALAAIPWATAGGLSALAQQSFLATHAQTQFLLTTVSSLINNIASRGRVTVPAKVLSDMARSFVDAQNEIKQAKDTKAAVSISPSNPKVH